MFAYDGIEALKLDENGELNIILKEGSGMIQKKPYIYQEIDGNKVEIPGKFKIYDNNRYGFTLSLYNENYALIIDPVLIYSTYVGGAGTNSSVRDGHDYGYSLAIDPDGNVYITGCTYSYDFPLYNAFQTSFMGARDAFVIKLDASGTNLIYSTYLGGSGWDYGADIAVDSDGNAYVTGTTFADDFPIKRAYQPTIGGDSDTFVAKLDNTGRLIYSSYFGGSGTEYSYSLALDSFRNIYITGYTTSNDFPIKNPFQDVLNGDKDAFVVKFNANASDIIYSTYLGGGDSDIGNGVTVDLKGQTFISGTTYSQDFPVKNAYQAFNAGTSDVFITKLDSGGSNLIYSTYVGGEGKDSNFGIAVDTFGNAYVIGKTNSRRFPVYRPYQSNNAGLLDAYITKLHASGSKLVFSTYLGGSGDDYGFAIGVDADENIYITGKTDSYDFPVYNAYQEDNGGHFDLFVTKLSK